VGKYGFIVVWLIILGMIIIAIPVEGYDKWEVSGTLEPTEGIKNNYAYTFKYVLTNTYSESLRVERVHLFFDWNLAMTGYTSSQTSVIVEAGNSYTFSWEVTVPSEFQVDIGSHIATIEVIASEEGVWSEWDIATTKEYTYTIQIIKDSVVDNGDDTVVITGDDTGGGSSGDTGGEDTGGEVCTMAILPAIIVPLYAVNKRNKRFDD